MSITRRLRGTILILALTLGVATAVAVLPLRGSADASAVAPDASSVRTKHVRVTAALDAAASEEVRFSGVTRGARSAMASFTVGGRLETRPIEIGDRIRRGQPLATLDGREYHNALASTHASLAEIESRLTQARRDVERSSALFDRQAATREEVEKVSSGEEALVAQHDAVASRVEELLRLVEESTLYAPIDGTVSEVFLEPGEYAAAGRPVAAISGQGGVEVEIELPEIMVPDLAVGQRVAVSFPLLRRPPAEGRITSLAASSLGPGRLFPVIVTVESAQKLLPGLTAEVTFRRPLGDGDSVPIDAVMNPGGRDAYLFVVRDGRAKKLAVDIRRLDGEHAIVDGELARSELVVVDGQFSLLDGDPVEIALRVARMDSILDEVTP